MTTKGLRYKNEYRAEGDIARLYLLSVSGKAKAETIISLSDLSRVIAEGRWYALKVPKSARNTDEFYLWAVNRHYRGDRQIATSLHRFVLSAMPGTEVDHINHDTLDNRRENLRIVTKSQNQQNIAGAHRDSKSGARNVYWDARRKLWNVQVCLNYERTCFGAFKDLEDAKRVALAGRKALHSHCPENSEAKHD